MSEMADISDTMSNFARLVRLPVRRSFFLFGPRGTGKSSLLKSWRQQLAEQNVLWLDLLDPEVEAEYITTPARLKQQLLGAPGIKWVVIDEVQKIPALLDIAHWAIETLKVRFALTGSSARKLKRGAGNLLAGRADTLSLSPLTHQEIGPGFDLDGAMQWGTLPGLWGLDNDLERIRFLNAYVHTYLREEIQLEQIVRNVDRFRQFLPLAGQFHGEPLLFSKIAAASGVDEKSVARYFEILGDTLIGIFLEPFVPSVRKRQSGKPKFYLFDNGVRNAIAGMLRDPPAPSTREYGRYFESWLILEMHRLNAALEAGLRFSYLRTKDDAEIDLIVERGRRAPILIEMKSNTHPVDRDARHLVSLGNDMKHSAKIIMCRTESVRRIANDVLIMPWQQAIADIFADKLA